MYLVSFSKASILVITCCWPKFENCCCHFGLFQVNDAEQLSSFHGQVFCSTKLDVYWDANSDGLCILFFSVEPNISGSKMQMSSQKRPASHTGQKRVEWKQKRWTEFRGFQHSKEKTAGNIASWMKGCTDQMQECTSVAEMQLYRTVSLRKGNEFPFPSFFLFSRYYTLYNFFWSSDSKVIWLQRKLSGKLMATFLPYFHPSF